MSDPKATEAAIAFEERLLDDFAAVFALNIAFSRGLMTRLMRGHVAATDPDAVATLMTLLENSGLVQSDAQGWQLCPEAEALLANGANRLQAKVSFTAMAAADLLAGGEQMLFEPDRFASAARTFSFFCYHRARDTRAGSLQDTAPWVEYVTALSEAEAPLLVPHLPLDGVTSLLEIGGNTGAFALGMLADYPELQVTVMDLPAVCHLGQTYAASRPEASRLSFHAGDARRDLLPLVWGAQPDLILFKSMLHDWTVQAQQEILARAAAHLAPGGRIVICERKPIEAGALPKGLGLAPHLVFAGYYRDFSHYQRLFEGLGFELRPEISVSVDLQFQILIAERRP